MSIKITSDSTADLTPEQLDRYGIEILPLTITLGDTPFRDGVDVHSADVFRHVDGGGDLPKTSAVSVGEFHDCFARLSPLHEAVINIDISAEMSACYQNACIAAEGFDNVYVIDSRSLSAGQGMIALKAAELARTGLEAKELVAQVEAYVKKVESTFIVDRLDYLYKGGRCSAVAALGANLLKLKPCIEVHNGVMGVTKKYRGGFAKALRDYAADKLRGRDDIDLTHCFVVHPAAPAEAVQAVMEEIPKLADFQEIVEIRTGCTVASHCGAATLGIMFARK